MEHKMNRKIIFHIDVNSAFLSWSALAELEKGSKTDLRLIPSIVGLSPVSLSSMLSGNAPDLSP